MRKPIQIFIIIITVIVTSISIQENTNAYTPTLQDKNIIKNAKKVMKEIKKEKKGTLQERILFILPTIKKNTKTHYILSSLLKILNNNQENNQKKEENTDIVDLYTENSLQRYVSEDYKISKDYVPKGLEIINHPFLKHKKNIQHQIIKPAKNELYRLAEKFHETFGEYLYINSSYRSGFFQATLIKNGCNKNKCAGIGASEHQLGLTLDFAVVNDKSQKKILQGSYFERMKSNAHNHGFINTYQKGIAIDGKIKEPRHRRYVGKKLATYLHIKKLSFAEYYKQQTIKI